MVAIILTVLKIIGIILLIILGILLLILLAILFVPIRYMAKIRYNSEKITDIKNPKVDKVYVKAHLSWLLHILRIEFYYTDELLIKIRVFGIEISRKEKDTKEEDLKKYDFKEDEHSINVASSQDNAKSYSESNREHKKDYKKSVSVSENKKEAKKAKPDSKERNTDKAKPVNKKDKKNKRTKGVKTASFKNKIKGFFKGLRAKNEKTERIKNLITDKDNLEAIKLIFKYLKKLLIHIMPKRIKGKIKFGFEDPHTTGTILSYLGILYALHKDKLKIIPVFDEDIIDLDLLLKGRIRLYNVILYVLIVWFNKNFKRLYRDFKKI